MAAFNHGEVYLLRAVLGYPDADALAGDGLINMLVDIMSISGRLRFLDSRA